MLLQDKGTVYEKLQKNYPEVQSLCKVWMGKALRQGPRTLADLFTQRETRYLLGRGFTFPLYRLL